DRFLFSTQLPKIMEIFELCVRKMPEDACGTEAIRALQQISAMTGNVHLMRIFADKLYSEEALEGWLGCHIYELSPQFRTIIDDRREIPSKALYYFKPWFTYSPHLRIRFDHGDIVCALFDRRHSRLVNDFMRISRQGYICEANLPGLLAFELKRRLEG
ncbi:hypothetical protein PMAYCL1PPCAC_10512, partial [Pristionchus mayeri]